MVLQYEKTAHDTITYCALVKYGIPVPYFFETTEYGKPFRTIPNLMVFNT